MLIHTTKLLLKGYTVVYSYQQYRLPIFSHPPQYWVLSFLNLFERQGKVISFSTECLSLLERLSIISGLLAIWISFAV